MVDIGSIKGKASEGKKAEKAPKIKLTKEQAEYVAKLVRLESRIGICREYIQLWMQFFRFFAEDLTEREVTSEQEKGFFQVSTQLAKKHFLFCESMADTFERGGDIIGVLTLAVSLANIQGLPENTRGKLDLDWHSLFLDMNKALGRLLRMLPGNLPLSEALNLLSKSPEEFQNFIKKKGKR